MKTRIIVDSTSDLLPEIKNRVEVVPLTLRFGDEEFLDGVTINHRTFYEKLIECDEIPTTSQAGPAAFAPVFEDVAKAGDEAVVITVSSKLSGTYQSARIAGSEYDMIQIVDCGSVAIGGSILVEYALSLCEQGLRAPEIAEKLEMKKKDIRVIALVNTLEYLHRGGRLSRTAAIAGALLNLKPVLEVVDGEILVLGKARGSKQGNNLLVQQIQKAGGIDFSMPLLLGYTGLSDHLLRKYMEDSRALWEGQTKALRYTTIGSVIGTHVGPGAIALAFFKKE